jgi:hypothetical protein
VPREGRDAIILEKKEHVKPSAHLGWPAVGDERLQKLRLGLLLGYLSALNNFKRERAAFFTDSTAKGRIL